MYCKKCGSIINDSDLFCGACGAEKIVRQEQLKTNTMAIVGVILAGISLLLNFLGLIGISAVVISTVGLLQINNSEEKGKELAVAGIAVGAFSVLYGFFTIVTLI